MALKLEITGLELKRISEDIQRINSFSKPLASLDENICDDVYAELHNLNAAESRSLPYSNKRHAADSLVKTTVMWNPVGDNVKEEPNGSRFFGNAGATQQYQKPFTMTNLYKKATYGEKENLESGSGRARGSLDFFNVDMKQPNINADLSGSIDGRRLQEGYDASIKPVTRLEIKVVDELNEAVGRPGLNIGNGEPANECEAFALKVSGTSDKIGVFSQSQPDCRPEDSLYFGSDSSIQTSIIKSREGAQPHITLVQEKMKQTSHDSCTKSTQSIKAPLLCPCQERSDKKSYNFTQRPEVENPCLLSQLDSPLNGTQVFEENVSDVLKKCPMTAKTPLYGQLKAHNMGECSCSPESLKIPMLSRSKSQNIEDAQTCEKISTQNNDYFVVLFSEQKKGSAGGIFRKELLKLSSLCSQYSHKILSWITSLATERNMRGCLRHLHQMFASPPRGFVNLNSKKMQEFSTMSSSRSSNRKLTKDKELKAVLMKINEVLVSMEKSSPDNV